jgi:hypothetical protein
LILKVKLKRLLLNGPSFKFVIAGRGGDISLTNEIFRL